MAINPKQQRFADEYLIDLNATQAAIRAGYSAASAHELGHRLLQHEGVAAAIQAGVQARAKRVSVSADEVLRELKRVAFADLSEAFDDNGRLLNLKTMPRKMRRVLSSVETNEIEEDGVAVGLVRKVKLADKMKALELLGKHLKLYTDKVEHAGGVVVQIKDPFAAPAPAEVEDEGEEEI